MEIWKDVVDFEGLYQVSNYGNFRRHQNCYLKSKTHTRSIERSKQINYLGYYYVDLSKNGKKYRKTVHQLVMTAFYPNFHYGDLVNHIDGNKLNNRLDNLEPTTPSDNEVHKYSHNLGKKPGKSIYRNVSIRKIKYKTTTYISYTASVKIQNKRIYIGSFKNEIDAAKAVDNYWDSVNDTKHARNFPKP